MSVNNTLLTLRAQRIIFSIWSKIIMFEIYHRIWWLARIKPSRQIHVRQWQWWQWWLHLSTVSQCEDFGDQLWSYLIGMSLTNQHFKVTTRGSYAVGRTLTEDENIHRIQQGKLFRTPKDIVYTIEKSGEDHKLWDWKKWVRSYLLNSENNKWL